jgi:glycosyltransferase involved in cell wall biosynthesis
MSVYNGEQFLLKSIESILGQTFHEFEFLIINDCSTDNSLNIIRSFHDRRIRLVENSSNMGLTKSLNRGLQLAQTEYIARQDADDISYPKRLERQVQFLDENPDVVLLGTRARAIDENGRPRKINHLRIPMGLITIRWYLIFQNAFIHSSVMFRRSIIWEKLKGYDNEFARAQDYELWSRTARSFKVENLPDTHLDYRLDYGSIVSQLPLSIAPEEDIAIKNLQVFLDYPEVPVEWGRFINYFRRKEIFDPDTNWAHVAEMVYKISDRYCHLHPSAKSNLAIQFHLAESLYWLSYNSAPYNRTISLQSFLRARKLAPLSHRNPFLAKYLALWCTGNAARHALNRLKGSFKKDVVS